MRHRRPVRHMVAVHEAGHGIVACAVGKGEFIHAVSIKQAGPIGGAVSFTARSESFAEQVIDVAGDVATALVDPKGQQRIAGIFTKSKTDHWLAEMSQITRLPREAIAKIHNANTSDYRRFANDGSDEETLNAAFDAAIQIALGRWRAIETLAEELYLHTDVSGDRVRQIAAEIQGGFRPPAGTLAAMLPERQGLLKWSRVLGSQVLA